MFHGRGTLTYKDESFIYDGEWENGKPEGRGIEMFGDGSKFEGDFKNGKWEGRGKYTWPNEMRMRYEGEVSRGALHGVGAIYKNDDIHYCGNFNEGKKVGRGFLSTSQGTL